MKSKLLCWLAVTVITMANVSCKKETAAPKVYGCTDPNSLNYNSKANETDGSCSYVSGSYLSYEMCYYNNANHADSYWFFIIGDGTSIIMNNVANLFDNISVTRNGTSLTLHSKYGIYDNVTHDKWDFDGGSGTITSDGTIINLTYRFDDILYKDIVGFVDCTTSGGK